jgi:hypothetical protein
MEKDVNNLLIKHNSNIKELIKEEIDKYFSKNKVIFNEIGINHGTHQVRDRQAYKKKENRCVAIVWNEGHGGQCSRSNTPNCDNFCKTHFKKGGNDWWLGTIHKKVERPVCSNGKVHIWLKN